MSTKKIQIVGSLVPDVATSDQNGLMSSADKVKLDSIATGATNTVVDDALNAASTNPVQNKIISSKFNEVDAKFAETKVFVATYGVTTYQEVMDAVNAGRVVQTKNEDGIILNLTAVAEGEGCAFTQLVDTEVLGAILTLDDQWEEVSFALPNADEYYTRDVINDLLANKADTTPATTTSQGLMSAEDKKKLNTIAEGATKVIVDSYLSDSSDNAVSNAAVTERLNSLTPVMSSTNPDDSNYMSPADVIKEVSSNGRTVYMVHSDYTQGLYLMTFNNASLIVKTNEATYHVVANQIIPMEDGTYVNAMLRGSVSESGTDTSSWEFFTEPIAKQSDVEQAFSDYPLIGNTTELTPTDVAEAINAGRPICVTHNDATYGQLTLNYAGVAVNQECVIASSIVYYAGNFMICEILGSLVNNQWQVMSTVVAEKTTATSSQDGLMSAADKSKLDSVSTGAEVNQNAFGKVVIDNTIIEADATVDALTIETGDNITIVSDADTNKITITANDTTYETATTSADGLMSTSDKTKLDGIADGADVNQNAFGKVVVGSTTIESSAEVGTLTIAVGDNVTITPDATSDKITIAATDTTYDPATQSAEGLMSKDDKIKLDGIATNANNYTLPSAGSSLGGVKSGGDVTISDGVITVKDDSHNHVISNVDGLQDALNAKATKDAASQSTAGLMSASDKKKLDGIASGADSVSFSRNITSGEKVGTITINGIATDVYAPDVEIMTIPEIDAICVIPLNPGLYQDGVMTMSWDNLCGTWNNSHTELVDGVFLEGYEDLETTMSYTQQEDNNTVSTLVGKLVIDDSISGIGAWCFYRCTGLTEVVLPKNLTGIAIRAFEGCNSLTNIKIPFNVDTIGEYAFASCSQLADIIIETTKLSWIGYGAFCDTAATSITFKGTMSQWENITKEDGWNDFSALTQIICSDGTITL